MAHSLYCISCHYDIHLAIIFKMKCIVNTDVTIHWIIEAPYYYLPLQRHNSDFLRRFHTILIDKGADLVALIGKIQMPEWFDKDHLDATMVS